MSSDQSQTSVRLPPRNAQTAEGGTTSSNKPPVWSLSEHAPAAQPAPLAAKCDRHVPVREGVCCKDLKGEDERTLVDPDVLRDVYVFPPLLTFPSRELGYVLTYTITSVIGLSDGLTVPFALTAGLSSLGESKLVILGGFAELIAGAISMGIGGFLASQAERDHYRFLQKHTAARVLRSCDGEMEREVYGVLGPIGVDEKTSRLVARNLRDVEVDSNGDGNDSASSSSQSVEEGGLRWSKAVGLTAFLLKFGEGLEEVTTRRMYVSAFTIGMGYLLGGFIPLLPYFFGMSLNLSTLCMN